MDNDLLERISRKLTELSVDMAVVKSITEESGKLQHEKRIRSLETVLAALVASVESLVEELKNRKDSNQYLITTGFAAVAILISVYGVIKHNY